MKDRIYLETGSLDPAYNLAFEEYVLFHRRDADYLILWQNEPTVVIGNNQITEAEINRAYVEAHGIHVVRRSTGGGAVYHDLGNLNYSFVTDHHPEDQLSMTRFTAPVVAALKKLGAEAEAGGRNDILVQGRKVSGTAQKIVGGRILHHGTLLFDSDPEAVAGALRVDPEKFRGKGVSSVRSRVGNIRSLLPRDMELPAFWSFLKTELAGADYRSDALTPSELEAVARLKAEKYDRWEWNFGRSPKAEGHAARRFPGGGLEVYFDCRDDRIESIRFFGDFLSRRPTEELGAALRGVALEPSAIVRALGDFDLRDYLGGIRMEELLSLLFNME